jgi:hypothetical protein
VVGLGTSEVPVYAAWQSLLQPDSEPPTLSQAELTRLRHQSLVSAAFLALFLWRLASICFAKTKLRGWRVNMLPFARAIVLRAARVAPSIARFVSNSGVVSQSTEESTAASPAASACA